MSQRINEIRARLERLKTPHNLKIDVSAKKGAHDISGIAAVYGSAPADIAFLLDEVDRLTTAATSALSCLADYTRTDTDRTASATAVLNRASAPNRPHTLSGGTGGGKGQETAGASNVGQMGGATAASTPEPPPTPGEGDVWQRVIDGLPPGPVRDACIERRAFGIAKYGTPLQAFNGRDWQKDLTQELLDAVAYSQQGTMEGAGDAAYFRDFALRMLRDVIVPTEVNIDRAQVAALGEAK